MARGSLSELDTQLQIAERLVYVSGTQDITELINRVFAKLNALIRSIQAKRGD
jgi:four helix bundle protein